MKKIKTFEQACKALKINTKSLPGVSKLPTKHRKSIVANYKLGIITEALNEGWTPNWNDGSQPKYFPWFEVKADDKRPQGFGFSGTDYGRWLANTSVGSRLSFKSSELALYAAKQFKKLYVDMLLIKK